MLRSIGIGLVAVAIGAVGGLVALALAGWTRRRDEGEPGSVVRLGGEPLASEAEKTNVPGNADAVCCRLPCLPHYHHCRALRLRDLGAEVPDRSATLVGYREREPGRLDLRAVLRGRTEGVCDAIAEEDQK